jgi:HEAT repeat protein
LVRAASGLANRPDAVLTPFASKVLLSCCRAKRDVPLLIALLKHESGWVRINAAKTLMAMRATEAAEPLARLLETAKDDADFGYRRIRATGLGPRRSENTATAMVYRLRRIQRSEPRTKAFLRWGDQRRCRSSCVI